MSCSRSSPAFEPICGPLAAFRSRRRRIDHVSVISDPCREAADCGAEIELFEDQPPAIIEAWARRAGQG